MVFFVLLILSSLSNKATRTAPKKEITILTEPIIKVFLNATQNFGSSKTAIKFSMPFQGEPKIPRRGVNYLNAIVMPYIGI